MYEYLIRWVYCCESWFTQTAHRFHSRDSHMTKPA